MTPHGLFWAVLDLSAERPLMLAVDDLQRSDRLSLRFLAYLARRIEELPVLLLATVRTGEPDVDEDLTNRDIAQQLFVTPKTVEVHLSAVYRKLGIASRRHLPDALDPAPA